MMFPWKTFLFLAFGFLYPGGVLADLEWVKVEATDSSAGLKVTGRVQGVPVVEAARIQGHVVKILKREGDQIRAGTPLFAIGSGECVALNEEKKVAQSRQLAELSDSSLKREHQLNLRVQDDQCLIVSGHSGTLTKRSLDLGAVFNVGDQLVTVVDLTSLTVELDISERDFSKVSVGQPVVFQLASNPGQMVHTKVAAKVPAIDLTSRTGKVRLESVTLPPAATIDSLVFGEIQIASDQRLLKIPTTALVFNRNKQFVVKKEMDTTTPVEIQVVSESDTSSLVRPTVENSLMEGDLIASQDSIFIFQNILMKHRQ